MVYRDEQSGELGGLSRVRAITQDDAHVFCRMNQAESEISKIWDVVHRFYETFDIKLTVRFSRHDPDKMEDYIGDEETWENAENQIHDVLKAKGVDYADGMGEAAFYGPKIDFMGKDAFGREFQAATIQLDMGQPEGFDLVCINENSERERIVMIHAAIAGSLERFMVLLIEQTAGAFPLWLSPEQVRLAPVNDSAKIEAYTKQVQSQLQSVGLRVAVDWSSESVGKKIRAAGVGKVPYTLVIGEKELETNAFSPRLRHGHGEYAGTLSMDDLKTALTAEVKDRALKSVL